MLLSTHEPHRNVQIWLLVTAAMVFAMAVIGAITRLTESGLSMVEWKPLIGALPPLSHAAWEDVFALYKQTPEFRLKNSWMGLEDFKHIFFWEWLHRLWGRTIGLVYALPLAWFWMKKQIPQGYKARYLGILALGASQGALGWYMVESGLVDRPDVSHFRLAAHLLLALAIYCCLLWLAFDLNKREDSGTRGEKWHGWTAFLLLAITITWGAFTAGLDGGKIYNTWPMMDAYWIPPEVSGIFAMLHNPAAVQFVHRWLAIATFTAVISLGWRKMNFPLMGMVLLQVGLGIATVLSQAAIPVAALHQAGAMVLLGLLIKQLNDLSKPA